ncbi:MAG: hypothetical protein IK035_00875, partial [Firmicutes bacterium]|nr:hypothetical protein [Bacillota bacterium]
MNRSFIKKFAAFIAVFAFAASAFAAEPLRIGVADDPTNCGRALKLLEAAGLIKNDPAARFAPEIKDITEYLYNVEIVPTQANTLTAMIDDLDAIVIGGNYGIPAGLIPSKNGLFIEKGDGAADNPFICVIAARTAEANDPDYAKIVSAYRTQLVAEYMFEEWKEARYPAFPFDKNYTVPANFLETINEYRSDKAGKRVIRVGVNGAMNGQWNAVQKILDERGDKIFIELVEFDAFNLPNEALSVGDIELNAFQHKAFL